MDFSKKVIIDSSVIVKLLSEQDESYVAQANKVLDDVKISLATLYSAPIQFVPETLELAQVSYKIAHAVRITYYDASFISLNDLLDAALVTDNPKHQAKFKGVRVIPLKDYQ